MASNVPETLNQSQRERLFYIDFTLCFLGLINRPDIVKRFGIKPAAATRDLSLYRDIAPNNLVYDTRARAYRVSEGYEPVFRFPGNQALVALLNGFGDNCLSTNESIIRAEGPSQLNMPDLETLSGITRAIHQGKLLCIDYLSLRSGTGCREIVPHWLVDNGLRWHVRAFDRKRHRFGDFVINRITSLHLLNGDIPLDQSQEADTQWHRLIDLHIVPHPNLAYPKIIEKEYGMQDGKLIIKARAALAGYYLRRWGVDCSENHRMDSPAIQLWLENRHALEGLADLTIAPGYEEVS